MKPPRISILLLFLMNMICNSVHAYDIAVKNDEGVTIYYNWINDKTELEVTYRDSNYGSYKDSVSIPETVTYNGQICKVTRIGSSAFEGCSVLTSLTIPNSVTFIGSYAFWGCSLTSIKIPNSMSRIGDSAFAGSSLTSITIPDGVVSIGVNAFLNCGGLTSVTIPNSVTNIEGWAFYRCSGLTSVAIPNSVTSIGEELSRAVLP